MMQMALVALPFLAAPVGVRFADDEAIRIIQLNAQAAVEIDSGDFNAARKNLVEAERQRFLGREGLTLAEAEASPVSCCVHTMHGGAPMEVRARREVILSGGAVNSPTCSTPC